ncbi:MAG: hypothetical protein QXO98_02640 [Sulfolobales archaeon]
MVEVSHSKLPKGSAMDFRILYLVLFLGIFLIVMTSASYMIKILTITVLVITLMIELIKDLNLFKKEA